MRFSQRGSVRGVVAGLAVGLVLLGLVLALVCLTFSVTVSGDSMQPTLRPKDRLAVDLLHRKDINRFDLVEATAPGQARSGGGMRIVKRVIGMPGDQITIEGGRHPRVLVKPPHSTTVYRVDNPTWAPRIGSAVAACCSPKGQSTAERAWATVPADSYWLIGDNWGGSTDGRVFGWVSKDAITAKLTFRILPLSRFGRIPSAVALVPAG